MTKNEFLSALEKKLSKEPKEDINKSLEYYGEMIDDRIEDGLSEEDAVSAVGSVEDAVKEIISNKPLPKILLQKIKPKRKMRALEIILLIVGSPLWLSLAIAAFAVFISVYAALWSVVISIYAANVAFAIGGVVGISFIPCILQGELYGGLLILGGGLICAGLAIFCSGLSKIVTKAMLSLGKIILTGTKYLFIEKGDKK